MSRTRVELVPPRGRRPRRRALALGLLGLPGWGARNVQTVCADAARAAAQAGWSPLAGLLSRRPFFPSRLASRERPDQKYSELGRNLGRKPPTPSGYAQAVVDPALRGAFGTLG